MRGCNCSRTVALPRPRPAFGHGVVFEMRALGESRRARIRRAGLPTDRLLSPSRQNTNTGTVTPLDVDDVFERLVKIRWAGSIQNMRASGPAT
jgi:hypothetical protein